MKKLVYILFICCYLTSCKQCKKAFHKTVVKGQVTDEATGEPIANLKISLIGGDYDFNSNQPATGDNPYTYTDSEGNYKFNFDRSEYGSYYLYCDVKKHEYYQIGSFSDYIPLEFSKKYFKDEVTKDIILKPYGVLKIHFKHLSTDTAYDVSITPSISFDLNNLYPGHFFPLYHEERNLNIYYFAYRPTNFKFQVYSINSATGNYLTSKDTIFTLNKKDTTYYQFNY